MEIPEFSGYAACDLYNDLSRYLNADDFKKIKKHDKPVFAKLLRDYADKLDKDACDLPA